MEENSMSALTDDLKRQLQAGLRNPRHNAIVGQNYLLAGRTTLADFLKTTVSPNTTSTSAKHGGHHDPTREDED
jgi:hypothetical protein